MSTIASEFTKEQLIARINQVTAINKYRISRDPDADGLAMDNELFAIALASLEAEPAIHRWRRVTAEPYGPYPWHYGNFICFSKPVDGIEDEYYYAAPPAPVSVPDEMTMQEALSAIDQLSWQECTRDAYMLGWNACRAAMLQGADNEQQRKASIHDALCEKYNVESLADFVEWQRNHIAELEAAPPAPVGQDETAVMPDYPGYALTQRECFQAGKKAGNSPVIPDGWVACSERMPTPNQYVLVCNGVWVGMGMHNNSEHLEDDERWQDERHEFIDLLHHPVTHWMPLPAPPQQEVKNG